MKKSFVIIPAMTMLLSGALIGCGGVQTEQTEKIVSLESESPVETQENIPEEKETEKMETSKIVNIITNGESQISLSDLSYYTDSEDAPVVYYLSDISSEAMVKIYEALEWSPSGKVAVKLSTGEPPDSNYL
ncbi:MAG: ferredoxin, partial [Lachnospiraceae bacterium]